MPGIKFTVLNRSNAWPIMIAVKDSSLVIGCGMAQKIIVT
ncbi:MAG: FeoA domain-containing protein [Deltaproteobacteria bacterium]|nr:FeoA domain-containing protein [Deltaproteobacteria bacterium]